MRTRPIVAAVVAVPLALTVLAACGSDYSKTAPTAIDQDARNAIKVLKSVHVKANVIENGSAVAIDLNTDTSGNCIGTVTLAGQPVSIIGLPSTKVYMKAGSGFWTAHGGAAAATMLTDKWITGFPSSEFESFCNLSNVTKSMTSDPVAKDKPKVVGTATVDGVDVVNLQVTGSSGRTTLSIATSAPHNLIKAVSADGKSTLSFSQFNQPVKATAPAGAIDISQLSGAN